MKEEYKILEEYYPYSISNYGNIVNLISNKTLKREVLKKGYLRVKLSYKINKKFLLHRLVALIFLPNPNNLPQVNHKDGNKQNNCVNNLEWCSNDYNRLHAINSGLWDNIRDKVLDNCNDPYKKSAAKLNAKDVLDIMTLFNKGYSDKYIADLYKLHIATIRNIKKGKSWSHITNIKCN